MNQSLRVEDFSEDLEQFWLLDFVVSRGVGRLHELLHVLLCDLTPGVHLCQHLVDQAQSLALVQAVVLVCVELLENSVDCCLDLVVCVLRHLLFMKICY